MIMTSIKAMMIIINFLIQSIQRNILRKGSSHVANHIVRDGSLLPRFTRSESYRRRYKGKHTYSIWKECYGPGAVNSAASA